MSSTNPVGYNPGGPKPEKAPAGVSLAPLPRRGKIALMKRYAVSEPSSGDAVRVLFDLPARRQAALRVGSVRLAPGERVPPVGLSQHLADEVALLVSGSLYGESAGVPFAVSAGEVTHIPAGEPHWAVAGDGGAEVFWLWFGTMEGENGSTDRAQ